MDHRRRLALAEAPRIVDRLNLTKRENSAKQFYFVNQAGKIRAREAADSANCSGNTAVSWRSARVIASYRYGSVVNPVDVKLYLFARPRAPIVGRADM